MDFLKILRSIEELLYEVMSWLVFYPRTLWMTLRQPLQTMKYSDQQQQDKPDQQYLETLSPPLFLVLSILLSHMLEVVAHLKMPAAHDDLSALVMSNDQNLLIFRALMFSVHPLLFAVADLALSGRPLDRDRLKTPFFAQCYLAGTTSILIGVGGVGIRSPGAASTLAGTLLTLAVTVWYVAVQRRWLMRLDGMTGGRALLWAITIFMAATAVVIAAALALY